jgi:branched-chain amino acid transport system ATP-binding protein
VSVDGGPVLDVRDLSVSYGAVPALFGTDIVCKRGDIVAVVGANAAGKTSLLRAIGGHIPYTGDVYLGGTALKLRQGPPDRVKKGLCLVPEQRQVFAGLTVEENLLLGAYRLRGGRSARQKNLAKIWEVFPLLHGLRRRHAGVLSGGEQQMLAIGRGLMSDPRVLLLDEPTLGLAPLAREAVAKVLVELAAEHVDAVVVAEQNSRWAIELASRIYVLSRGRVVADGAASEFKSDEGLRAAYFGT